MHSEQLITEDIEIVLKEDLEGEEELPNTELETMSKYFASLMRGILLTGKIKVAASQNRSRIKFDVFLENDSDIALVIGPKFRVINAILTLLRFQQYRKHNRWIEVDFVKSDGTVQNVADRWVFTKSKVD